MMEESSTRSGKLNDVDDIMVHILGFLDVNSIMDHRNEICHRWRHHCDQAIDMKLTNGTRKAFEDKKELMDAILIYSKYKSATNSSGRMIMESIASSYGYPINKWDVSKITDFSNLFDKCRDFNEDIHDWDVSNATNMNGMFAHTTKFNQSLSSWNLSKVTNMRGMFSDTREFNQDLSSWATRMSSVKDMSFMFFRTRSFDQDISSWDVSNVRDMSLMFGGSSSFRKQNQILILSKCNISTDTEVYAMFDQ